MIHTIAESGCNQSRHHFAGGSAQRNASLVGQRVDGDDGRSMIAGGQRQQRGGKDSAGSADRNHHIARLRGALCLSPGGLGLAFAEELDGRAINAAELYGKQSRIF
jgi:hypothetical protein